MSMRMKAPLNHGSVSFGGVEYIADDKGFVDVPGEAVADLLHHGYTIVCATVNDKSDEENKSNKKSKAKE